MISAGDDEADDAAFEQRHAGVVDAVELAEADQVVDHAGDADQRQDAGCDQALVERAHDRLARPELHEERADDRGDDADAADGERQRHHVGEDRRLGEEDRREHHGGDRGHRIGLEQVGGHAGAVADVVTDVVGDRGRVARIILRDARLDLADEVAADVRTLGEDAAAETGEDRDQRGAEAERHHGVDDGAAVGRELQRVDQEAEIEGHAEQRETRHQHAGDRARLEGELEAAGERRRRGLGGAHIGADRNVHADEAGRPRQNGADQKADRDIKPKEIGKQHEDDDADDADRGVLAPEIRLCAFTHRFRDLLHAR